MRIVLGLAYNGAAYHGWQSQENALPTIQGFLQTALSQVAAQAISVIAAGRTDKGVHALQQIVHFDTTSQRDERAWVLGCNSHLPPDIRVHWARTVDEDFHARFSAIARSYRYFIFNHRTPSAIAAKQSTWHIKALDEQKMHQAAQALVGEHDFTSFRASQCQAKSPLRTIEYINISRHEHRILIHIKANSFLHHMVRNIAGVLMPIGTGEYPPHWVAEVLRAKDRKLAGITAPASGLFFESAYYPDNYAFPSSPESLWL